MSIEERIKELQGLFDESQSLISSSVTRLESLLDVVLQQDKSFDEIRLLLQDLLSKLRSSTDGPYGPFLQDIYHAAIAIEDTNNEFNIQLNNVFKTFQ